MTMPNNWLLLGNDGTTTGLCAAENQQDAQDEATRIGIVGTLVERTDWLSSSHYAAYILHEKREGKKALIDVVVGGLGQQLLLMEDSALTTEGLARKAVAQYAQSKKADIDTWTESQVDNYDPVTDPQLQV